MFHKKRVILHNWIFYLGEDRWKTFFGRNLNSTSEISSVKAYVIFGDDVLRVRRS